jgi:exocyst complex component 4
VSQLSLPRLLLFLLRSHRSCSVPVVPVVDFGDDATDPYYPSLSSSNDSESPQAFFLPGRSTARLPRMSKLQRFLQNLALKPAGAAADPTVDETLEELLVEPAAGEVFGVAGGGADSANGANEDENIADGLDGFGGGGGADKDKDGTSSATRQQQQRRSRPNPEVDSFAYIEMLLEALAALGKLGYALDAVGQRIQGELFALVEATIEDVEERQVVLSFSLPPPSCPVLPACLSSATGPRPHLSTFV